MEKRNRARALKRECSERFRDGGATMPNGYAIEPAPMRAYTYV